MKCEAQTLRQALKQALALQGIATVVLLFAVAVWLAVVEAREVTWFSVVQGRLGSTLYGALLAVTGTVLSARSVMRGFGSGADQTGWSAMGSIYVGLLNKLVIIGGGIACGLILLRLAPLWLVIGYIVVQIAGAGVMLRRRFEVPTER